MRCPVCNSEMKINGSIWEGKDGLPLTGKPNSKEIPKQIPYYECGTCKMNEEPRFAYQRTYVKGKWYFFSFAKWNFLKDEFNPSRRE